MTKTVERGAASPQPPFPSLPPPLHPEEALLFEEWQRAPSSPLPSPPPDCFLNLETMQGCWGNFALHPPSITPPPSPILPVVDEGQHCPLALEEIRRGAKSGEAKMQTRELELDTAKQCMLKQIQQGVELKPVSSDVTSGVGSRICALKYRHLCWQ